MSKKAGVRWSFAESAGWIHDGWDRASLKNSSVVSVR